MSKKPIIGITMGDPAGIGPEIILKLFSKEDIFKYCSPIVIGDARFLAALGEKLSLSLKDSLPVLDLKNILKDNFVQGKTSKAGGGAAVDYIKKGVSLALGKEIDALVTCPINKKAIHLAGFKYPGHTELLAELTKTKNYAMMLSGGDLRVVLITTHLPIEKVSKAIIKKEIIRIIRLTDASLVSFGIKQPRLAVTGLNPHAGDGGVIGKEEKTEIIPAIIEAQRQGINVSGPFPADTVFTENIRKKYDAIITMFHDQALIPLKMLSFGQGVNITLGLPIIRTSVDHGTAFDIVGKGIADISSLKQAIKTAVSIIQK